MSKYEELEKLSKLKESGVLTENEYQNEKEKLLSQEEKQSNLQQNESNQRSDGSGNQETLGYIILILPTISALTIFFSSGLTLINYFNMITLGTFILTTILATVEASVLGLGKNKGENGPVVVFISMLLIWVIAFPYYFSQRKKRGLKISTFIAFISAILFTAAYVFGYMYLEDLENQVREYYNNY